MIDKLKDAKAIDEFLSSRAGEIFRQLVDEWKKYYLSTAATAEYAAIVAANKCQALEDLTESLISVTSVATEETPPEAAAEPKSSPGRRAATRSLPQTI